MIYHRNISTSPNERMAYEEALAILAYRYGGDPHFLVLDNDAEQFGLKVHFKSEQSLREFENNLLVKGLENKTRVYDLRATAPLKRHQLAMLLKIGLVLLDTLEDLAQDVVLLPSCSHYSGTLAILVRNAQAQDAFFQQLNSLNRSFFKSPLEINIATVGDLLPVRTPKDEIARMIDAACAPRQLPSP